MPYGIFTRMPLAPAPTAPAGRPRASVPGVLVSASTCNIIPDSLTPGPIGSRASRRRRSKANETGIATITTTLDKFNGGDIDAFVAAHRDGALIVDEFAPYVWGGITPWGADCSGFVQTVFGLHGVALPRDAKLQAEVGDEVAGVDKMATGDLAFFSDNGDGAISHVALALGEGRVAHVALGRAGFHIENLGDRRDTYAKQLAERFVKARRVL